jgi:hypothetical protein
VSSHFSLLSRETVELDVLVVRHKGEQPGSRVTFPCEPASALVQFVFGEAETPPAAACDDERMRSEIERCPPVSGKNAEADRLELRSTRSRRPVGA